MSATLPEVILKTTNCHHDAHSLQSFLLNQYARFKQFTINLLKTLFFEIAFVKDNYGPGLSLVTDLQISKKRKLPVDTPSNFIVNSWQKVIDNQEINQSHAYELCVLLVLKDRLQSGDIFDYASQLKILVSLLILIVF